MRVQSTQKYQLDQEIDKKLDVFWAKVDDRMSQVNKDIGTVKENTKYSNVKIQTVIEEIKTTRNVGHCRT